MHSCGLDCKKNDMDIAWVIILKAERSHVFLQKSSFDLLNFMYNTDKNLPAIRLFKKNKSAACAFSYAVKHESWHLIPVISKDKGSYTRARVCRIHPSMTDALFIKIMDCALHVSGPFFLPSPCSLPLKAINTLQKILVFERHKIHYEAERKDSGQRSSGGRRRGRKKRGPEKWKEHIVLCVVRYKWRGNWEEKKRPSVRERVSRLNVTQS